MKTCVLLTILFVGMASVAIGEFIPTLPSAVEVGSHAASPLVIMIADDPTTDQDTGYVLLGPDRGETTLRPLTPVVITVYEFGALELHSYPDFAYGHCKLNCL